MELLSLWLPILVSASAVWIVSLIASMALPHHKQDWIALPDSPEGSGEDGFMDDLRKRGIKPGNYLFPDFRDPASMKSEKVQRALNEGPVGHLSLWPTPLTMADKMLGTFLVHLAVSTVIAYLTTVALPQVPGLSGPTPPTFARIFQIVATAGVLAYCFAHIPNALWWGTSKRTIAANIVDGLLYAAITGLVFAWLWPR